VTRKHLRKCTTFSSSLNEKIDKVEEENFLVPYAQQPVQETPEDLLPSLPEDIPASLLDANVPPLSTNPVELFRRIS
jgi:hypothetical protein